MYENYGIKIWANESVSTLFFCERDENDVTHLESFLNLQYMIQCKTSSAPPFPVMLSGYPSSLHLSSRFLSLSVSLSVCLFLSVLFVSNITKR